MSYLFWLDLKKPVKGVFDIQKKPDGKTISSGGGGGVVHSWKQRTRFSGKQKDFRGFSD